MKEGAFTTKLLKEIRKQRPGAIVRKVWQGAYSDRGTPDFFVCEEGRTSWCEVKMASASHGKMFEPIQLETAKRMRSWYLIWSQEKKVGYLFLVSELMNTPWYEMESYSFAELVEKIRRTF